MLCKPYYFAAYIRVSKILLYCVDSRFLNLLISNMKKGLRKLVSRFSWSLVIRISCPQTTMGPCPRSGSTSAGTSNLPGP